MGAQRVAGLTLSASVFGRGARTLRRVVIALIIACVALIGVVPLATAADSATCEPVPPTKEPSREINLVIDDSGSMFYETGSKKPIPRWSSAKYSVEVFAALLGPNDELNVYLLSDADRKTTKTGPRVTLSGSQSAMQRVQVIHEMDLKGAGTLYVPVESAYQDLIASTGTSDAGPLEKWLVILTDGQFSRYSNGKFNSLTETELQANMETYSNSGVKIGFLSLGDGAMQIRSDESKSIFSAQAPEAEDLIAVMTQFSNRIFQRNESPATNQTTWTTDLPLNEVVVFAQGADVAMGSVQTSEGSVAPESSVDVKWADNPSVKIGVPAIPDKNLQGVVATYKNLPPGELSFDIQNSKAIDYFYKPNVSFGVSLKDANGVTLSNDAKVSAGTDYTVDYGFKDADCNAVSSPLLGDVSYTATLSRDGSVIMDNIQPGQAIQCEVGKDTIDFQATYLNGSTSRASKTFECWPNQTKVELPDQEYVVSEMADFPPASEGNKFSFTIGGKQPSVEQWDSIDADKVSIESPSNLEFRVVKGEEPGLFTLTARAPGGDIYKADTGQIQGTLTVPPATANSEAATTEFTITVIDDLSATDRWINWLRTVGWKLFLALLLLIILIGYIVKPRFSKKVKASPTVVGIPRAVGTTGVNGKGKFRVNTGRKLIPYVADTAALSYVPSGTPGFQAMKLKAGRGKTMIVTNWKALAKKGNVEVNGTPLDENTKKAPTFAPSATIAANSPQMTYELTPNV